LKTTKTASKSFVNVWTFESRRENQNAVVLPETTQRNSAMRLNNFLSTGMGSFGSPCAGNRALFSMRDLPWRDLRRYFQRRETYSAAVRRSSITTLAFAKKRACGIKND
jgi:hypothetical protein